MMAVSRDDRSADRPLAPFPGIIPVARAQA